LGKHIPQGEKEDSKGGASYAMGVNLPGGVVGGVNSSMENLWRGENLGWGKEQKELERKKEKLRGGGEPGEKSIGKATNGKESWAVMPGLKKSTGGRHTLWKDVGE